MEEVVRWAAHLPPEKKSSTLCTTKSSTLYYFLADPGCVLQM
jgi:hypothetical protein